MAYSLKIILLSLITSAAFSFNTLASTVSDTTKKQPILIKAPGLFNYTDNQQDLKNGLLLIRQKKTVEQGLKLLASGIKNIEAEKKVFRLLGYSEYEFANLLIETNYGNLTPKQKQKALAFYSACFSEKPNKKAEKIFLNQDDNSLFSRRMKLLAMALSNHKETDTEINNLLTDEPKLLSAKLAKADRCFYLKNYDCCIDIATQIIALEPDNIYAKLLRAKCYVKTDDYAHAVSDFDSILTEYPNNYNIIYNKADALFSAEKYKQAIELYRSSYMINNDHEWPLYIISRCYNELEMRDSALFYINMHINQYPDDGFGYNFKGTIYYDSDDYMRSIEFHTLAINYEPDNAQWYEDRAGSYYYNDQYDLALADLKLVTEMGAESAYVNDRMGDCYYRKKDYKTAIQYHLKATKLDPQYKYAFVGLNLCYNRLKDYDNAIKAAEKAVKIDTAYSTAWGNLGWSYYCLGNNDACIKYSYVALKYKHDAAYAMFNIALATLKKGDTQKATELYRNFYNECKKNDIEIKKGAIDDLKELVTQNIYPTQASYIIENIFLSK